MLTYCPGRKVNSSRFGISTLNETVVGDSRVNSVISLTYVAAVVLATSDVLAILSTRSDFGFITQGST